MFLAVGFFELLPAIILLLAFTIVGGVIIFVVRRKLKEPPSTTIAFTLGDLRKLRDQGDISIEEYNRAKESIIQSVKKSTTDSH
ncbi:MAG TPA: SHOCT domain-containing protein [Phycisphaerales bacterium]|nr:SHOCT domain-containing protein [Phycisphaerales bacterium]HIO52943.1 SHOCT domain-containing protein [Phycisphaerales bacterium]